MCGSVPLPLTALSFPSTPHFRGWSCSVGGGDDNFTGSCSIRDGRGVHWKVSQNHLGSSRNEYLQSHSHLSCVAASVPHSAFKEMQLGKLPSEYASLRNPFVPYEHVSHSIKFRVLYCSIAFHEQQVERERKPSRGRGGHAIRRNRPSQARGRQVNFVLPQIISPLFQNTQIT